MTEYQKIHNELTTLGWIPENGSGDHVKFLLDKKVLVISKSLSHNGRAIKNTYAVIRRTEPRFSLKRQTHMLQNVDEQPDEQLDESLYDNLPDWIRPGNAVRWTGPENKDYEKISDKNSVMNCKYIIAGFLEGNEENMVLIAQQGKEENAFPVNPDEIDTWETDTCDGCLKTFPKNVLIPAEDEEKYCETCFKTLEETKSPKKNKPEEEPEENQEQPFLITLEDFMELIPDKPERKVNKLWNNLVIISSGLFLNMLDFQKDELMEETKNLLNEINSKQRKNLKRMYPALFDEIETWVKKNKKPQSPYDTWKDSINNIGRFIKATQYDNQSSEKIAKSLFSNASYTIRSIKNPYNKNTNFAIVIEIITKDWDTTAKIYKFGQIIISEFRMYYREKNSEPIPVFLLVNCPSIKFKQYLLPIDEDTKYYENTVRALEILLPEKEKPCLIRAFKNIALPSFQPVVETIKEKINETKRTNYKIITTFGINDSSKTEFEQAEPFYCIHLGSVLENNTDSFDAYVSVVENLEKTNVPFYIRVSNTNLNKYKEFMFPALERLPEVEIPFKTEDEDEDIELLHVNISPKQGNKISIRVNNRRDDKQDTEHLADALYKLAHTEGMPQSAFNLCLQRLEEDGLKTQDTWQKLKSTILDKKEENNENNTKNTNDNTKMENNDILDLKNPASPNTAAAGMTTRELLQELKLRGVECNGITITVKKEIDFSVI